MFLDEGTIGWRRGRMEVRVRVKVVEGFADRNVKLVEEG